MRPSLSGCGLYVAVLSGETVQVHALSQTAPPSVFASLRRAFEGHGRRSQTRPSDVPIVVHQIGWERVLPGASSSKYAVSATCGGTGLVLVFGVAGGVLAVIEVDAMGIDRFEWFPAVPPDQAESSDLGSHAEPSDSGTQAGTQVGSQAGSQAGPSDLGALSNSTMIAVHSRLNLHLKVYSLFSTQVLVTVPKPCSHVIFHPTKPRLWSVVAQPYYPKNSAARRSPSINPRINHFYTDGVTCSQLVSLELPGVAGAAEWSWSPSGKWLMSVDRESRLAGPEIRVYNLYGIHRRGNVTSGHVGESHVAHPTLTVHPKSSLSGSLWGRDGSGADYLVRYKEDFDSGRSSCIPVQVIDIPGLCHGQVQDMALSEGVVWSHFRDLDMEIKYSRLGRVPPVEFRWRWSYTFGSSHVLASEKNVCIFRRVPGAAKPGAAKPGAEVAKQAPPAVPVMSIFGDSRFLQVHAVEDCLAVAYTDHVSLLHAGTAQIVATSRYSFSHVTFSISGPDLAISMVEDTPSGPLWRRVTRPRDALMAASLEPEVTDTFQNKRRDIYRTE